MTVLSAFERTFRGVPPPSVWQAPRNDRVVASSETKLGRYDDACCVFKDENRRHSSKDTRFGIGAVSNERYGMWE